MKKIIFTVTSDLSFDQRMIRICTSLSKQYEVLLIGRKTKKSVPLLLQTFDQKRLNCFFQKGKLFYIEYNIRLFFFLLFKKMDAICAIDLDTILPCYFISGIKKVQRIYDAHELFCEMKEVVSRKGIYKMWKSVERCTVPNFKHGYTVNKPLAEEFMKMYGVHYEVIRNISTPILTMPLPCEEKFILYQGAVNEGRCFETLIPAMKRVSAKLYIYGIGNFLIEAKELVRKNGLENKVLFKGAVSPDELRKITSMAYIGITLFENNGLNNYYSLGNRFFDYMQAGIPQLCSAYPAYVDIDEKYHIAMLITDHDSQSIAGHLNKLLEDEDLYRSIQQSCLKARSELNWQNEEKKLLDFYEKIFEQT